MITGNENAYPVDEFGRGLTIRQHFASMMMTAALSNPEGLEYVSKSYGDDLDTAFERIANKSVRLADALIKELNKTTTP